MGNPRDIERRKQQVGETSQISEQESMFERRVFHIQTRTQSEGDELRIGGYAAMFNKYANMGWFLETMEPGFFDGCDMEDCACLFNHDSNMVLGRKKSGTLELKIDNSGLDYLSRLPKSRADVFEIIERGDVYQSSFGFTVKQARWEEWTRDQLTGKLPADEIDTLMYGGTVSVRILEKCKKLYDVSPVTFPAYADTTVAKRSFDAAHEETIHPPEEAETVEETPADDGLELEIDIALLEHGQLITNTQ